MTKAETKITSKTNKKIFPSTLFVIRTVEEEILICWESVDDIYDDNCIVGIYKLEDLRKHKLEHTLI